MNHVNSHYGLAKTTASCQRHKHCPNYYYYYYEFIIINILLLVVVVVVLVLLLLTYNNSRPRNRNGESVDGRHLDLFLNSKLVLAKYFD